MSLRRLGVLLTEIAIGDPVLDAGFCKREGNVQIDFKADVNQSEGIYAARTREILRRVRDGCGEDYKDAVEYRLMQGADAHDQPQVDPGSFFDNVVHP